ncbi:predicted protein [Naegleria gruberi]|uniref:Predicted protein n=1 Tax=Naegleria gruberi TaxID=5762 RepID=D2VZM2_NAEGR|nr:uncharacterized protein NAEGRDRAFT_53534 [Naegleria gruberi]EFC37684.1 predicted protein [Naegleria gruberi]|eukprot:XP_002670428.1 predicted protein [Naegleria gruberi strain NEG-M]
MNQHSRSTRSSSTPTHSNTTTRQPQQQQQQQSILPQYKDVIDKVNEPLSLIYFESSSDAKAAKRTLNWGLYFYEHGEYIKSREALIKCGEVISKINSKLSTINNNNGSTISLSSTTSQGNTELVQVGKDLLYRIILLVECLDKIMKAKHQQSIVKNQATNSPPKTTSKPNSTPTNSSSSSSSSTQGTLSRISSGIFSTITSNFTSIKSNLQKEGSSLNNTNGNNGSNSKLIQLFNNVGNVLKKPKEEVAIPNLADSYVQDQYVFVEFIDEKKPNEQQQHVHSNLTNSPNDGNIPPLQQVSSSRDSLSKLQKRLQTVMKGSSTTTNTSLQHQQPQQQQQVNLTGSGSSLSASSLPGPIRLSLDALQTSASATSPNGEVKRGPQTSRLKSFIQYMEERSGTWSPETISEEEVREMVRVLNENLKILSTSSNYKTMGILAQMYDQIRPYKKQVLKELSSQSTKDKSKKILMLKKIISIAFSTKMVNHYISKEENYTTLQENFLQYFELDLFTLHLLNIYAAAENFDHTNFCLSHLVANIELFSQAINDVNQYQVEKRQIYKQVDELIFGHLRNRIIELKWCFGVDTFAYVTNDFDSDALESLELLLKCLDGWLKIKTQMGDYSVNNRPTIAAILTECLAHFVRKLYILNREMISNNLKQSPHLRGFFLEASFDMNLSTFVVDETKQLCSRFASYFDKYFENTAQFKDIVAVEFSKHLSVEVKAFCQEALKYQQACMEQAKKNKFLRVYFNDLNLGVLNKLVSHFVTKYRILQELSPCVKDFEIESFYEIVSMCITVATPNRLKDFYSKVMSMDTLDKPIDKTVLYTFSCIDMANASLKPIHMIYNLDTLIRNGNDKYLSFLTLHFEAIRPTISEYLQLMLNRCKYELSKVQGNVHDRIRLACIAFNNVNGLFMYAKDILQQFNSSVCDQLLEDYDRKVNPEEESDQFNINILQEKLIQVYDFPSVKSITNEIRMVTTDMAFFIADWLYNMNEQRFEAIFNIASNGSPQEKLFIFLSSLDRFFMHLSDNLYLELLHEVLRHLYVIYVQKLVRNKLLGYKQKSPLNASELLSPITGMDGATPFSPNTSPVPSHFPTFESSQKVTVQLCLDGLKDLFNASGEGLDSKFLDQQSRELDILILIYNDETDILINLYENLIGERVDDKYLTSLYQRLAPQSPNLNMPSSVSMPSLDDSDSISIASSSSSTDSFILLSLQEAISSKRKNSDFLSPELILLLLNQRKKDRTARSYARRRLKELKEK